MERIEKVIKKWTETVFKPGQPPQPPEWAKKEEESIKEVPVEGEQKEEPEVEVGHEPPPPKQFTKESIPNLGEFKEGEEVELIRFPESSGTTQERKEESTRQQEETIITESFPKGGS